MPDAKPKTRLCRLGVLKSICNRGHALGLLPAKPEFPVIPHHSTLGKAEKASELVHRPGESCPGASPGSGGTFENCLLLTLVETVLRIGLQFEEARLVRREHIDLAAGTIRIPRRERATTKALYPSPVRISAELKAVLNDWLGRLPADCQFVFPGKRLAGPWERNLAAAALRAATSAAGVEGVTYGSLRRFFDEHVVWTIPCLSYGRGPVESRPSDGEWTLVPLLELTIDQVTELMASLKREADTFQGHRAYAMAGLTVFAGLKDRDLLNLRIDTDIDMKRRTLFPARRQPAVLGPQAVEILERWINRPDRGDSPFLFPANDRLAQWPEHTAHRELVALVSLAALVAGIRGRVNLMALRVFWRRSRRSVVLGDAWRNTRQPAPIPSGPPLTKYPARSLPTGATWSPDTRPAIVITGPDDHVFVRRVDKGVLPPSWYKVLKLLSDAFPEGLSAQVLTEKYGNTGWRVAIWKMTQDVEFDNELDVPPQGRQGEGDDIYRIKPF